MELIVLAVSFVTNGIVFGAKKLAGLAMFSNGAEAKPFLRFTMILFCAIGVVAKSLVIPTALIIDCCPCSCGD
jgi:hypothetical protein